MGVTSTEMADDDVVVIAKYDYTATDTQELNIKKGEKLVLVDDTQHWWRVMNARGASGYVPSNYVKRAKQGLFSSLKNTLGRRRSKKESGSRSNVASPTHEPSKLAVADSSAGFGPGIPTVDPVSGSSLNSPGQAQHLTSTPNTSLTIGDASLSANGSALGPLDGSSRGSAGADSAGGSSLRATSELCIAKFAYSAAQPDEISITKGDRIAVIQKSTDGWWKGRKLGSEVTGWFPSNYVVSDSNSVSVLPSGDSTSALGTTGSSSGLQVQANRGFSDGANSSTLNSTVADSPTSSGDVLFLVETLYQFAASTSDELDFTEREILEIIEKPVNDPEWWRARNAQGLVGLVPRNYVRLVPDQPQSQAQKQPLDSTEQMRRGYCTSQRGGVSYVDKVWYWGHITRLECDAMLMQHARVGEFVVRDSESNPADMTVTMHAGAKNRNFKVKVDSSGVFCIGQKTFHSLDELIQHYMKHPIYKNDTEKHYLTRPFRHPGLTNL